MLSFAGNITIAIAMWIITLSLLEASSHYFYPFKFPQFNSLTDMMIIWIDMVKD